MQTPIADFVRRYAASDTARLHMPGHKGRAFLGCEPFDITEIAGADALYEADGIIAQSEANAAGLFGTARTLFSTEGSSQCIRAMLCLCLRCRSARMSGTIVAARNVHKAFVFAAALLGFDIHWLWPERMTSLCACEVSPAVLEQTLSAMDAPPAAVYITSRTIWAAWQISARWQRYATDTARCWPSTTRTALICASSRLPCIRWIWAPISAAILRTRPCPC